MYVERAAEQFNMSLEDLRGINRTSQAGVEGAEFVAHEEITGVVNGVDVKVSYEGRMPNKPGFEESFAKYDKKDRLFNDEQKSFQGTVGGKAITPEEAADLFSHLGKASRIRDERNAAAIEAVADVAIAENEAMNKPAAAEAIKTDSPEAKKEEETRSLLDRIMGKRN